MIGTIIRNAVDDPMSEILEAQGVLPSSVTQRDSDMQGKVVSGTGSTNTEATAKNSVPAASVTLSVGAEQNADASGTSLPAASTTTSELPSGSSLQEAPMQDLDFPILKVDGDVAYTLIPDTDIVVYYDVHENPRMYKMLQEQPSQDMDHLSNKISHEPKDISSFPKQVETHVFGLPIWN